MSNVHLFELLNAPPGLDATHLWIATAIARWLIFAVPALLLVAWIRADRVARHDLLIMLLAVGIGLGLAQVVAHVWPQPRPFALHLGTQYLEHANDPGLPSDHATVFWTLAFAAWGTRRYAVWAFPLLAAGLIVGWSRVYLGVHFPFDVLAAFPVAIVGAAAAHALRGPALPVTSRLLSVHDAVIRRVLNRLRAMRHA